MTHARLFGVTAAAWLVAQTTGCGRSDLLSWDSPGEYGGSGSSGSNDGSSGANGSGTGSGSSGEASGASRGDARAPDDAASGSRSGASGDDGSSDDGPTMVFTGDDSTPTGDGSTCGAACPGCCQNGLCVSGLQELACGRGGGACTVCSAELSCAYGFCQ